MRATPATPAVAPTAVAAPTAAAGHHGTAPATGTGTRRLSVPDRLSARLAAAADGDAGMTTAEYAVGTVAACGFGGVLYKVITNDSVLSAIAGLIGKALTLTFG